MGTEHEGGEPDRFDDYARTVEFHMILAVAEALRAEFGVTIDAHPGGVDAEAGDVNRALLAMARVIIEGVISPGDDPAAVLTWALRQAALRRLVELGVVGPRAEALLDMEPGLGDRWLAYLTLAPGTVIEDLMRGEAGR